MVAVMKIKVGKVTNGSRCTLYCTVFAYNASKTETAEMSLNNMRFKYFFRH